MTKLIGGLDASGSHSVSLPKNKKKLNIQDATAAFAEQGISLKLGDYDLANKTATYVLTDKSGKSQTVTSAKVKDFLYGTAKA